jgi:hypothetical protein
VSGSDWEPVILKKVHFDRESWGVGEIGRVKRGK